MNEANKKTLIILVILTLGMLGMAFASVPLYRMFCQVTGFGGTTQKAVVFPARVTDRIITVRFNADTHPDLPWEFKPMQGEVKVRVGDVGLAFYHAKNLNNAPAEGMATYNVTPNKTGIYFNKVECFCFERQHLEASQETDFPVQFFIDPAFADDPAMKDVDTITLSYTFFKLKGS
ncbi:Cytochrome c oxidase assembly protein CtaG [Candidatus Bealeia paramacronuclearis]|uniref:Cytochrome c oxidase assembly protein CtaG n=1 Tax=Candidatus Bealeia paramacronuclearis TaxID=1921001 RepID=A0ABZ2C3N8_9PROT|nr:Cytochrome c oxidase assembly protein CtaG [Candidatus Bealeia paramacronuclearis]